MKIKHAVLIILLKAYHIDEKRYTKSRLHFLKPGWNGEKRRQAEAERQLKKTALCGISY